MIFIFFSDFVVTSATKTCIFILGLLGGLVDNVLGMGLGLIENGCRFFASGCMSHYIEGRNVLPSFSCLIIRHCGCSTASQSAFPLQDRALLILSGQNDR